MENKSNEIIKDCSTCKYSKYNDHWNLPFCYSSDDCEDWNKWEQKKE